MTNATMHQTGVLRSVTTQQTQLWCGGGTAHVTRVRWHQGGGWGGSGGVQGDGSVEDRLGSCAVLHLLWLTHTRVLTLHPGSLSWLSSAICLRVRVTCHLLAHLPPLPPRVQPHPASPDVPAAHAVASEGFVWFLTSDTLPHVITGQLLVIRVKLLHLLLLGLLLPVHWLGLDHLSCLLHHLLVLLLISPVHGLHLVKVSLLLDNLLDKFEALSNIRVRVAGAWLVSGPSIGLSNDILKIQFCL